ncbi:MAG: hypothetical protein ACPGVG_14630 [Mycobacterium sp.]
MSAITPTDVHRDDIDADWEEVAREHEALTEFRRRFVALGPKATCTDAQLYQRYAGLVETGIAMIGPMPFHRVKREARAVMKERGLL